MQSGESPPESGLESLMRDYQAGDSSAANELVRRVSPALYRYFLHHTQRQAEAEDLLQETWLRLHRARAAYRAGEPAMPWIFAIANHTRLDRLRRTMRRPEVAMDAPPDVAAPESPPDSGVEELLRGLPDSQREVLLMLKVSGMSLEEVAKATGSSVGSVKQKAHRAYEKLRSLLGGARP
jgi:RNA polymerase sigma-70 factor, ECF subfamily